MANNLSLLIDIGNKTTKIVYVKHSNNDIIILDFDTFKTPHELISDDEATINILPEFSKLIKKSLEKMNVKTKNVCLSISNTGIITRETVLPMVDEKQLKKMIEMEIPQNFLVDLKEFVIDYKISEKRADRDGVMQYVVFMVAAPLKVVDNYLNLMLSCDLEVTKIDFYGNSISKLIGTEYKEETDKTIAVLDIGNVKTNVSICRGKTLKYSRSVFFGRTDFDNLVMETEKCYESEVESIYKSFDMMKCSKEYEGSTTLLERSFSDIAADFVSEVTRILDFYNSRGLNNHIDKIIITGGFSSMKNFDMYLSQEFTTATEIICTVKNFKIDKRENDFQNMRMVFSNCLGAVL